MKRRIISMLIAVMGTLMTQASYAAGSAETAKVFATVGNEPTITIVVTDSNGIGCLGVPVSISVTAGDGSPAVVSAATDAGGTTTVAITGSTVGDTINIYCSSVATGQSNTVTAANARAVDSSDGIVAWFNEPWHTLYAAVIDPITNVMVTVTSASVDDDDIDNDGDSDTKRLTFGAIIMQNPNANPYEREVCQGTYDTNNTININVDDISGDPDVSVGLASLSNSLDPILGTTSECLHAYAVSGANPQVVASVIDREGRGIKGVTVTAQCSAGVMTPASAMTNDNGLVVFQQSGGALGDFIRIETNLEETLPIDITTATSSPMASDSKVFTWFEKKTRNIYTAVIDRTTRVLVTSTSDMRRDYDELSTDDVFPYAGNFVEQTSSRPASSNVVYGGSEAGDLIRIYHLGTVERYPGGASYNSGLYANSVLTMPDDEEKYLMACAAPGTDPKVWAMVTDQDGNAVKNVPINYSLTGGGVLDLSNTVTVWSGLAVNKVTGGSLGDRLTVSSPGLGEVVIELAASLAPDEYDRLYAVYDPEKHLVLGAIVQPENNVMTTFTSHGYFDAETPLDKTPTNGVTASCFSATNPQNENKLCQGQVGFGTVASGDILRIYNYPARSYAPRTYITVKEDPDNYLLAFAMPGDVPEVFAVTMDKYGNATANLPISIESTGGAAFINSSGQTNHGGYFSTKAAGVIPYGNTITVSSPGLPPVHIWPDDGSNYSSSDMSFMWFDPTTLLLRNVTFEIDKKLVTNNNALATSNVLVFDASANNKTIAKGYAYDQDGDATYPRIGVDHIIFNTAGVGDIITANFGTSNAIESYITIQSINNQFLHAYATGESYSQTIVAVVTDADGNAIPDITVNFSADDGLIGSPPPGGFKTDINGQASTTFSSVSEYYKKVVVSTPNFNSAPIEIVTLDQNDVRSEYRAIPFYNRYERKVNVVYVHSYFNCVADNAFSIDDITAIDNTVNDKTVAIGPLSDHPSNAPATAYLAANTSAVGDQIAINDTTAEGSPDALITLGADADKYLMVYGTGGPLPVTITAVVVDHTGLGSSGEVISFTPSGGGAMSVTDTVTDANGVATSLFYGPAPIGSSVTVDAPNSVTYTALVKTALSSAVAIDSRVYSWFEFSTQKAKAAVVSRDNNILTSTSTILFTAQDETPNGKSLAIGSTLQQTETDPAETSVVNGTQGGGDLIVVSESTTLAEPDGYVKINVPFSELSSTLLAAPDPVLTNQEIALTMRVYNTGGPDALSVSPSAIAVTGPATYLSGPTPATHALITGGSHQDFSWTYTATAPDNVSFNGQAFGVDAFTMSGLTSTATDSNSMLIRDPAPPALTASLVVNPTTLSTGQMIDVTMTVRNDSSTDVPQALTVTAGVPVVSGGASYYAGPTPTAALIPRGEERYFIWQYAAGTAGPVTFTARAYTVDPFDAQGVTSNAAAAYAVVQSPAALTAQLIGPDNAERLRDFTLTMRVSNMGQAAALGVVPQNLTWSSPDGVLLDAIGSTMPSNADIAGGNSQDFSWNVSVGSEIGELFFNGSARGSDANSGNTVVAPAINSNVINVIQGAINLDRVTSPATNVYQGQKNLQVKLEARNTSLLSVTITAAALTFNGAQQGFVAVPATGNPTVVGPQSSFEIDFNVDIQNDAPLGRVVIDGAISGDAETGAMAANGAQFATAEWTLLKPRNSLQQNYPNPLKLSNNGYTIFPYYLAKDEEVSIKLYNLAGELVAVLVEGRPGVGRHEARWYGDNGQPDKQGKKVGSGVYMAVFKIGEYQEIKKVVVIR